MNRMIADIPNSKHDIELQIMNKLVQQFSCMAFRVDKVSEAEIYIPKALQDEFEAVTCNSSSCGGTSPEQQFEFQCKLDRGDVPDWPLELLHPSQCRVKVSDQFHDCLTKFIRNLYSVEVNVNPFIDKFGRCRVNGQVYSSEYNSTDRGSIVKCMFVLKENNLLHPYFGVIHFFFKLYIILKCDNEGSVTTVMEEKCYCYVSWMTFKSPEKDVVSGLYMVNNTFYGQDKIISPRRIVNRCILAPLGGNSSGYYVTELPI